MSEDITQSSSISKQKKHPLGLYIVPTPIGNLQDMTFRSVAVLKSVAMILCEDTRTSLVLFKHYHITTPYQSCHAHNEAARCRQTIKTLLGGKSVALICDAGTPTISDCGQLLVRTAHDSKIRVIPLPGACMLPVALCASGIEAKESIFVGFLPAKKLQRKTKLKALKATLRPCVLYEAPHRIRACLEDLREVYGDGHKLCLCKEVTKIHETVLRGPIPLLQRWLEEDQTHSKGEFTLVVEPSRNEDWEAAMVDPLTMCKNLCKHLPKGKAASLTAKICGCSRSYLYTNLP